jgi:hypothetical protein
LGFLLEPGVFFLEICEEGEFDAGWGNFGLSIQNDGDEKDKSLPEALRF